MAPPPSLDYAPVRRPRLSPAQRRLILVAGCLGVSWLLWLWIGLATFDPFDDSQVGWLVMMMGALGTVCGLLVYVVALCSMMLWSAIRRCRASAS